MRDLLTNKTTLVSRASSATEVKGNAGRSARRSRVTAGMSHSTLLRLEPQSDDTFPTRDIYVRDLVANTTTLVSRQSIPRAEPGDSFHSDITSNARFVAFDSLSASSRPATKTPPPNVRDGASTYVTCRRAPPCSPVPAQSVKTADFPALAANGQPGGLPNGRAARSEDTDDAFSRFVITTSTCATSNRGPRRWSAVRAAPPSRLMGNLSIDLRRRTLRHVRHTGRGLTPDDTDEEYDVYVRDLQDHVTSLESRATPGYERYVRPAGATPLRVPLVPAYTESSPRTEPMAHRFVQLLRAAEPCLAQPHLGERTSGARSGTCALASSAGVRGRRRRCEHPFQPHERDERRGLLRLHRGAASPSNGSHHPQVERHPRRHRLLVDGF